MSLEAAWGALPDLKPQIQGTCGLYSFWYATQLLAQLGGTKGIVYPRKSERPTGVTAESSRYFAKGNANSGQGEILSEGEMLTVVVNYGYTAYAYKPKKPDGRKAFITHHLNADRPVLIPYLMDKSPEVTRKRSIYGGGDGAGAHWSLIIGEDATEYRYLEPNDPNQITTCNKDVMLASNACVDKVKFVRYWIKPAKKHDDEESGIDGLGDFVFKSKAKKKAGKEGALALYDLGKKSRQHLDNVLIAVG